jgi:hypothetical protein
VYEANFATYLKKENHQPTDSNIKEAIEKES